jgi:hypothetical protein
MVGNYRGIPVVLVLRREIAMTHVRGQLAATGSLLGLVALTIGAAVWSITEVPMTASAAPTPVAAVGPSPTATTGPPAPGSTSAICHRATPPTAVTVARRNEFPQNDISFVFPAQVVSTNEPAVAALARTLCALPPFPSGAMYCPADFGVTYLITFWRGTAVVGRVTFDPAGCPRVTGLGPPRQSSASFEDGLAASLDLSTPTEYCDPFRGRLPTAPSSCGAPTP